MGNDSSKSSGPSPLLSSPRSGGTSVGHSRPLSSSGLPFVAPIAPASGATFLVSTGDYYRHPHHHNKTGDVIHLPPVIGLRIGAEALYIVNPDTSTVITSFAYHKILCWGYTSATFQWKVFKHNHSATSTGEGKGSETSPSLSSPPLSPKEEKGGEEKRGEEGEGKGEERTAEGKSHPSSPPLPSTPVESSDDLVSNDDKVDTFIVFTSEGVHIEAELMGAVRRLMVDMESVGINDRDFNMLYATLLSLGDSTTSGSGISMGGGGGEGADQAINMIKQLAATRKFDVRQAVALVKAVGELSPFDKLEAAVVLYGSVMNKESYPLILECFEDPLDRDNICHRLGIHVDGTGSISATKAKTAGLL